METYLKQNHFDKRLNKLKSKLKNKRIIIYGAGQLCQAALANYDFSELNIIAICDKNFPQTNANNNFAGYPMINLKQLEFYDYDYILIATKNFVQVINDLSNIADIKKCIPMVNRFIFFNLIKSTNLEVRYLTLLGKTFTIPVLPSEKVLSYLESENPRITKNIYTPRNLYTFMANIAAESSARYVMENMHTVPAFNNRFRLLEFAIDNTTVDGKFMEFGVYKGESLNFIANRRKQETIYGFDSFEGLPESWTSTHQKGHFKVSGLPKVKNNVKLVKGWFDQTIPEFIDKETANFKIAFIHVDCDLYQSTKTMFDLLKNHIQSGTVVVFDEYINYPNWEKGEFKAFQEFVKDNNIKYKYIGYVYDSSQTAIQIL